jgi:uncharacterized membrane protein YagU involved in acid resistance
MSTQIQTNQSVRSAKGFKTIFWAGLICGILDGLAAIIFFYAWLKLTPGQVMQFIASGIYGPAAFAGGTPMVWAGIAIHFFIAFVLAVIYFYAYPKISLLHTNPVLSGLLYGLGIWLVLNLLVMPASNIQQGPFDPAAALISIVWHMLLVGLPIALITKKHFYTQI